MKPRSAMVVAFFLGICGLLNAQSKTSGVYISYDDFVNHKMVYAIDCSTESHKIKLNDFLDKDYITVVHQKKRTI